MGACCASEQYDRIEPETASYKVCLVGPCAVGKTALMYRYFDGCFIDAHVSTIGVDVRQRRMASADGAEVVLTCFDTCSAQERFRNGGGMSVFNRMHAIVLVYSAAEPDASLRQLLSVFWQQIAATRGDSHRPVVICRSKSDLAAAVEKPELALLAELTYATSSQHVVHTSAKTGDGVDQLFQTLVSLLVNQPPPKA